MGAALTAPPIVEVGSARAAIRKTRLQLRRVGKIACVTSSRTARARFCHASMHMQRVGNGAPDFEQVARMSGAKSGISCLGAHAARASVGRRDLLAMLRADPGYRFAHPGYVCYWLKMKNSDATAVKREAEEDWGR